MRAGDEVRVRIVERVNDDKALVEIIETKEHAILKIKGRLRLLKDGSVSAWVIQHNKTQGDIVLGNAYFGKYDISPNLTTKYVKILKDIFNNPEVVKDEDISALKGMVNRCIKHDQWDWYTTYKYIGYPSYQVMNMFVKDSVEVRDSIRNNEREKLLEFRTKYLYLLQSVALHLDEEMQIPNLEAGISIREIEQELWERMSFDSRNNIRIAEKIAGTASKYILMHYLVTMEQELFSHYIQPFIYTKGNKIVTECNDRYLRTCHEILTGKTHFSLGAIYYLGKNIDNSRALRGSDAMREFYYFLGNKCEVFKEICNNISAQKICGLRITELRNGLAHGNSEIIAQIDSGAYSEMHKFMLEEPVFLMKKILENSLKY